MLSLGLNYHQLKFVPTIQRKVDSLHFLQLPTAKNNWKLIIYWKHKLIQIVKLK